MEVTRLLRLESAPRSVCFPILRYRQKCRLYFDSQGQRAADGWPDKARLGVRHSRFRSHSRAARLSLRTIPEHYKAEHELKVELQQAGKEIHWHLAPAQRTAGCYRPAQALPRGCRIQIGLRPITMRAERCAMQLPGSGAQITALSAAREPYAPRTLHLPHQTTSRLRKHCRMYYGGAGGKIGSGWAGLDKRSSVRGEVEEREGMHCARRAARRSTGIIKVQRALS